MAPVLYSDLADNFDRSLDAAMMQKLLSGSPHGNLRSVAASNRQATKGMETCSGGHVAEAIAHLLTVPSLHANCLVLETLVSFALCLGTGQRGPKRPDIARWFRALSSGAYGREQDPAEDLFVARLPTLTGNYRLFEGTWEGGRFHAGQFVGVLDRAPKSAASDGLRSSVLALLTLSEEVARRSGVGANTVGGVVPLKVLPAGTGLCERASRARLRFTPADLDTLGIPPGSLEPFILDRADWPGLLDDTFGHTRLERRPLISLGRDLVLLLPTAVSAALRRLVIETYSKAGAAEALTDSLATEVWRRFSRLPLLGGPTGAPVFFTTVGGVRLATFLQEIDAGRWINWMFFVDDFLGYDSGGMVGLNPGQARLDSVLETAAARNRAEAAGRPGFRSGVTVLVSCGWGRGMLLVEPRATPGWRTVFISAADLDTMSRTREVTSLSLWRTLDNARAVHHAGVKLVVPNGFLNLWAWESELNGALAPHYELPNDFGHDGVNAILVVPQNALLAIRAEVAANDDTMAIPDESGRFVEMRRSRESVFADDPGQSAMYESWDDAIRGNLVAASPDPARPWWLRASDTGSTSRRMLFEHWQMLCTWLSRAVPILVRAFPCLPERPITWDVRFEHLDRWVSSQGEPLDQVRAGSLLAVAVDLKAATVTMTVPKAFEGAFRQPENVAEVAIVSALVEGTAELADARLTTPELASLVETIIPSGYGRHIHFMFAGSYRDLVADRLPERPIMIERQDTAYGRIGLAWRARQRGPGHTVTGRADCNALLNDTVKAVEREVCVSLRTFCRRDLLGVLLENHEAACYQRDRWHRTAASNIELHRGRSRAVQTIGEQGIRLNSATLATRIAIEAAVCECPDEGIRPGSLDVARLMADAMTLFRLGGWSDAIRWEAMRPSLKVSSLGDIRAENDFEEDVLAPLGRSFARTMTERGIAAHAGAYKPSVPPADADGGMSPLFFAAWHAEFGSSFDAHIRFLESIQKLGDEHPAVFYEIKRSDLARALVPEVLSSAELSDILDSFVFRRRAGWGVVPQGYLERDRAPWRFRRRLSVLRRPIVELDCSDPADPTFLIAPGLAIDGSVYLSEGLLKGQFPETYVASSEMRSWLGKEKSRAGHAFNDEVAARMRELGWEVRQEVGLPSLFGYAPDANYGDVDVLAWNRLSGRVLAIECKDLQFRKTPGEVAEQMSDFRGGVDSKGRPDHLRKHLLRCEQLDLAIGPLGHSLGLAVPARLEPHLVFKNPVPMQFVWERMASRIKLSLFSDLDCI